MLNFMTQTNISEVLENQKAKNKYTFTINPDGSSFYMIKGKKVSEREMEELYPTKIKTIRIKGGFRGHAKIFN